MTNRVKNVVTRLIFCKKKVIKMIFGGGGDGDFQEDIASPGARFL